MSAADRLRAMVEAATPGPWTVHPGMGSLALRKDDGGALRLAVFDDWDDASVFPTTDGQANARLAALAPEVALWAADAIDELEFIRLNPNPDFGDCGAKTCTHPGCLYTRRYDALLYRAAVLVPGTEGTQE